MLLPWLRPKRQRNAAWAGLNRPDLGVWKEGANFATGDGSAHQQGRQPGHLGLAGGHKPSEQAVVPPLKGDVR